MGFIKMTSKDYPILSETEIDHLLDPYISREDLISRWKETLVKIGKPTTMKEIEKLAQILKRDYRINPGGISSLFNRRYVDPLIEEKRLNLSVNFNPISFEGTEKFEYSDEDFVSTVRKRLEYPKTDIDKSTLGPTNSDLDSCHDKVKWCHEDYTSEDQIGFHHGMLKCQCHLSIPDNGFICQGCKRFIKWRPNLKFLRCPVINEEVGGWGNFFCSRECLLDFPPSDLTDLHDIILETIDSTIIEEE